MLLESGMILWYGWVTPGRGSVIEPHGSTLVRIRSTSRHLICVDPSEPTPPTVAPSMGSSLSRPTMYPFPMPAGNDPPLSSKLGKWSLSTRKKSKKGKNHENLDDFDIGHKFPTSAVTYPLPYCAWPPFVVCHGVDAKCRPTDAIRVSCVLCTRTDGVRTTVWDATACPRHAPVRPDGIPNCRSARPTRYGTRFRNAIHRSRTDARSRLSTCPRPRHPIHSSHADARPRLSTRPHPATLIRPDPDAPSPSLPTPPPTTPILAHPRQSRHPAAPRHPTAPDSQLQLPPRSPRRTRLGTAPLHRLLSDCQS